MSSGPASKQIAIAVVQSDDRILIGRRGAAGPLAGYWEFPGGKVQPGESPALAAVRECREETALEVRVERLLSVVDHTYAHGALQLHFYLCVPCDSASDSTEPRNGFRWAPRQSLAEYEFPPANAAVVAQLLRE